MNVCWAKYVFFFTAEHDSSASFIHFLPREMLPRVPKMGMRPSICSFLMFCTFALYFITFSEESCSHTLGSLLLTESTMCCSFIRLSPLLSVIFTWFENFLIHMESFCFQRHQGLFTWSAGLRLISTAVSQMTCWWQCLQWKIATNLANRQERLSSSAAAEN